MHPHLTHQLATEHQRKLVAYADRAWAARRGGASPAAPLLAAVLPAARAAAVLRSAAYAAAATVHQEELLILDGALDGGHRVHRVPRGLPRGDACVRGFDR